MKRAKRVKYNKKAISIPAVPSGGVEPSSDLIGMTSYGVGDHRGLILSQLSLHQYRTFLVEFCTSQQAMSEDTHHEPALFECAGIGIKNLATV
jgi:hypothetical protein